MRLLNNEATTSWVTESLDKNKEQFALVMQMASGDCS